MLARARERGQEQPEGGRGAGRDEGHDREPGEVAKEIESEDEHRVDEHHRDLRHAHEGQVCPLAEQQPAHAQSCAEHSLERARVDLVKERSRPGRRGEEQEHDRDPGRVERDHVAFALLAHDGLDLHLHERARVELARRVRAGLVQRRHVARRIGERRVAVDVPLVEGALRDLPPARRYVGPRAVEQALPAPVERIG